MYLQSYSLCMDLQLLENKFRNVVKFLVCNKIYFEREYYKKTQKCFLTIFHLKIEYLLCVFEFPLVSQGND